MKAKQETTKSQRETELEAFLQTMHPLARERLEAKIREQAFDRACDSFRGLITEGDYAGALALLLTHLSTWDRRKLLGSIRSQEDRVIFLRSIAPKIREQIIDECFDSVVREQVRIDIRDDADLVDEHRLVRLTSTALDGVQTHRHPTGNMLGDPITRVEVRDGLLLSILPTIPGCLIRIQTLTTPGSWTSQADTFGIYAGWILPKPAQLPARPNGANPAFKSELATASTGAANEDAVPEVILTEDQLDALLAVDVDLQGLIDSGTVLVTKLGAAEVKRLLKTGAIR